jgi:AraC-like DNA-binding protein
MIVRSISGSIVCVVEEAKKQLTEHPGSKIQDVAEHCGFSSRRVFTQVFIRETGVKPSEWGNKG